MYNYMNKKLDIPEDLMCEFEKKTHEKLSDLAITVYLEDEYNFDSTADHGKLETLKNNDITTTVIKRMRKDIAIMS